MRKYINYLILVLFSLICVTIITITGCAGGGSDSGSSTPKEIRSVSVDGSCDYAEYFLEPIVYNGALYFRGEDDSSFLAMYAFDGSSITNVTAETGCTYAESFSNPIIYDGALYFSGYDTSSSKTIYAFDGPSIFDVNVGTGCDYDNNFSNPIIYDGSLYFLGKDTSSTPLMYAFNGSSCSGPDFSSTFLCN